LIIFAPFYLSERKLTKTPLNQQNNGNQREIKSKENQNKDENCNKIDISNLSQSISSKEQKITEKLNEISSKSQNVEQKIAETLHIETKTEPKIKTEQISTESSISTSKHSWEANKRGRS